MSQDQTIAQLTLLRKVVGFANLGVLAAPRFVADARATVQSLQATGASLGACDKSIAALGVSVLPAQRLCQEGLQEVEGLLKPLLAQRRGDASRVNPHRPRPN